MNADKRRFLKNLNNILPMNGNKWNTNSKIIYYLTNAARAACGTPSEPNHLTIYKFPPKEEVCLSV
jgi:hypothetical protein